MRFLSLTLLATLLHAADEAKSTPQRANKQTIGVAPSAPNADAGHSNETRGGHVIPVGLRGSF